MSSLNVDFEAQSLHKRNNALGLSVVSGLVDDQFTIVLDHDNLELIALAKRLFENVAKGLTTWARVFEAFEEPEIGTSEPEFLTHLNNFWTVKLMRGQIS